MIITVFGATGQVGRFMVSLALVKGHTVRAFGRNVEELIDHYQDHDLSVPPHFFQKRVRYDP